MNTLTSLLVFAALSAMAFGEPGPPREEWHRGLKLEEAVRSAELIVAVRVEEVKEVLLVRGGKGEFATFQFRFKPLRTLKGVFARPELVLGSSDLEGGAISDLKFMKAGQMRLLFLSRSDVGYQNCNRNERSLDLTFPPLAGEDDLLMHSVITLLAVNAETNRFQRVKLLSAALEKASGASAGPLLAAVSSLALLAAQIPEAAPAILRHLGDASPAVRTAAALTLQKVLEADYLEQPELREKAGAALALALAKEGPRIDARTAIINACGALGIIHDPALIERLDFTRPANSIQERDAKVRAVGMLRLPLFADKLFALCQSLPTDGNKYSAEVALARLDPARGRAEIARHAEDEIAAGSTCFGEVDAAATLPAADAVALLIQLADLPLNDRERETFARMAQGICQSHPDERLVAPLSKLLDPNETVTRMAAVTALAQIGSRTAAQALQGHLAEEPSIERKLMIAGVLGKHGMRDGYAYAIEHVSESYLTDKAVAALTAMRDPRTLDEAKKIFETSNDARWNAAAIRILGAIGAKEFTPKFLALAADRKNPLAPSALIALADLGEAQALPLVRDALNARGEVVAEAGAEAAGRLLKNPEIKGEEIRDLLAALLASDDAPEAVRDAALEALLALNDPRLDKALTSAVSDAMIDHGVLSAIESALRARKVKLR